ERGVWLPAATGGLTAPRPEQYSTTTSPAATGLLDGKGVPFDLYAPYSAAPAPVPFWVTIAGCAGAITTDCGIEIAVPCCTTSCCELLTGTSKGITALTWPESANNNGNCSPFRNTDVLPSSVSS